MDRVVERMVTRGREAHELRDTIAQAERERTRIANMTEEEEDEEREAEELEAEDEDDPCYVYHCPNGKSIEELIQIGRRCGIRFHNDISRKEACTTLNRIYLDKLYTDLRNSENEREILFNHIMNAFAERLNRLSLDEIQDISAMIDRMSI